MKVEVLGPLQVSGTRVSPREGSALAALVVRRGRSVEFDELADAIWGERPPATWRKQVQIAVGRLRRLLGPHCIETVGSSYALHLDTDELDVTQFEKFLDAARQHAAAGDSDRSADACRRGLALWRGPPLAEVTAWPRGADEAGRLEELRQTAEEGLLQAELDSGLHRSVVASAQHLVRAEPTRERRWTLLATALYRSGRQQDALGVLREARRRLRDELGLDPGTELSQLEEAILRHDTSLEPSSEPPPVPDRCPYRGLNAFDVADADEFFGREVEIGTCVDALQAKRLVVVTGPSGCGKSSLARAGAVHRLVARGKPPLVVTPGPAPEVDLMSAFASPARGVIVIDQFEELFQAGLGRPGLDNVGRAIADYTDGGGSVLVTVRSDFIDQCANLEGLGSRLSDSIQFLTPMSETGLRAAIEEPARLAGLRLEPGLTEVILRDVRGGSAAMPHMSHALVQTWVRREGRVLTVAGYEACGGISGAIAQSAEGLFVSMSASQRELCRTTFLRLISPQADGIPVRRRAPASPLTADLGHRDLLARLTAARLVLVEDGYVQVAHESLATAWPRLRHWLEEDVAGAQIMQALAISAEDWAVDGELDGGLLTGGRLKTVQEWQTRTGTDLTPLEERFLAASAARERDELALATEKARVERRRSRRLRLQLVAVAVLLVLSIVAGTAAFTAQRNSASQTRRADAASEDAAFGALAATSIALRPSQRDVAALLAAEAYRLHPDDPRARDALMSTLVAARGFLGTTYLPGAISVTGRAADDSTAVIVDDRGQAGVYRLDSLQLIRTLPLDRPDDAPPAGRTRVAISADGDVATAVYNLVTGGALVTTASIKNGQLLGPPTSLTFPVGELAVAPDGEEVAVVSPERQLATIQVASGGVAVVRSGVPVNAVGYDPDGRLVASHEDGTITLDGQEVARVKPSAVSGPLALDGQIAVTSGVRHVAAVDLHSRRVLWSDTFTTKLESECLHVTISRPAGAVFCGDQFGRIQRRDLYTGQVVDDLDRQLGDVGGLHVSADGSILTAVGGGAAGVSTWRLDGAGPTSRIIAPGRVVADRYNVASDLFLAAPRPPSIVNWDQFQRFEVWDDQLDRRIGPPIEAGGLGWVAPDVLLGVFNDTGKIEYLDTRDNERSRGEDPLNFASQMALPGGTSDHMWVSYSNGRVYDVDPASGSRLGPPMRVDGYPMAMAPSDDDSQLAVSFAGPDGFAFTVFDTRSGERLGEGDADVVSLAFDPAGQLFGATDTGRLSRFSVPSLDEVATLPGARGWVNSLQFSDDGALLLATSNDGTVSLYDAATGSRLGDPIPSEAPGIVQGFLKPDGSTLLVTVTEGVAAWNLDPDAQLDAVCRIAGRSLTAAEWDSYLKAFGPYSPSC